VLAFDEVPFDDFEKMADLMSSWQIGQTVQVTVRRGGHDMKIAVNTIFNPVLRFKSGSEIKGAGPIAEKDVTVLDGANGNMTAFSIAEFGDWENPVDTLDMFKTYAIAAAANAGANAVHILRSPQEVQAYNRNADKRLGFLCVLLVMPKARLGVEFETGTGYENRRVVRRIQNNDAEQAGLRIGDNILAMNGFDVLRNADLMAKDHMMWEVGQTVEVTVARDGKEVKIPVKTTSNH